MNQITTARACERWFIRGVVRSRLEAPRTRLPLDEEYWLALRHPAEVADAGVLQLASTNPGLATLSKVHQLDQWREFRGYVRQAEGFYRGATTLPWKSSPLNHYYSFMNLAKACVLALGRLPLRQALDPRILKHGLSARIVGTPETWKLTVHSPDGIFALLYEVAIGVPLRDGTELDARELLSYVAPISWQLTKSRQAKCLSWWACHWVFLVQGDELWDLIGVPREADIARLPSDLSSLYEELTPDAAKALARETLGLRAVEANGFRFLQRTKPIRSPKPGLYHHLEIEQSLRTAIPNCVYEHLDSTDYQFCIGLPYATANGPIPMNELVASYAVMYFLSSLVRYHPDYIDTIGESTDAWLIESFAKSAPLSLLCQLAALSLGYSLVIQSA